MLSREYVQFLESLPCNRHARKRSKPVGQWLSGWVPEQRQKDFYEPMQQAFIEKDAPDGTVGKIARK
jgi:hypothetical protein